MSNGSYLNKEMLRWILTLITLTENEGQSLRKWSQSQLYISNGSY